MQQKYSIKSDEEQRIDSIVSENNLVRIETGFFRGKTNVTRVQDVAGTRYILKTDGIDRHQPELLRIAKNMESQLSFRVPELVREGKDWLLLEEVIGDPLDVACTGDLNRYVGMSEQIAREYQQVIAVLVQEQSLEDMLREGTEWTRSRLDLWSRPLVEAGLVEEHVIGTIRKEFEETILQKGDCFFGWAHGNIISDHILVSQGTPYLLDLSQVARPGKGYYDFLRALDFMFLKSDDAQVFKNIPRWMGDYLLDYDEQEVRLVFTLRMMGILGWDIIHENVEYIHGDIESKKAVALRCINREY